MSYSLFLHEASLTQLACYHEHLRIEGCLPNFFLTREKEEENRFFRKKVLLRRENDTSLESISFGFLVCKAGSFFLFCYIASPDAALHSVHLPKRSCCERSDLEWDLVSKQRRFSSQVHQQNEESLLVSFVLFEFLFPLHRFGRFTLFLSSFLCLMFLQWCSLFIGATTWILSRMQKDSHVTASVCIDYT